MRKDYRAQAIIVENPGAEIWGEPVRVRTYDFTYSQRTLLAGLRLALQVQDNPGATNTEQVLAHVIIEVCKALAMLQG